jgi:multimeric flavodoxin WrbA
MEKHTEITRDGIALGSPDYFRYMAGGLKQFFDDAMSAKYKGMQIKELPYVAFVTHGGGGGAIESIEKLAERFGFKKVAESVLSKGAPRGEAANSAVLLGQSLAESVIAKQ